MFGENSQNGQETERLVLGNSLTILFTTVILILLILPSLASMILFSDMLGCRWEGPGFESKIVPL